MSRLKNLDGLFAGRHFDRDVIILCVRWYHQPPSIRYG
jgi:transposase-like protein